MHALARQAEVAAEVHLLAALADQAARLGGEFVPERRARAGPHGAAAANAVALTVMVDGELGGRFGDGRNAFAHVQEHAQTGIGLHESNRLAARAPNKAISVQVLNPQNQDDGSQMTCHVLRDKFHGGVSEGFVTYYVTNHAAERDAKTGARGGCGAWVAGLPRRSSKGEGGSWGAVAILAGRSEFEHADD